MEFPVLFPLAGVALDDVFGGLVRDASGLATFSVEGAHEKISVIYGPKYTVAVVYAPPGRPFICFEPMSTITDGFNLAHAGIYTGIAEHPARRNVARKLSDRAQRILIPPANCGSVRSKRSPRATEAAAPAKIWYIWGNYRLPPF